MRTHISNKKFTVSRRSYPQRSGCKPEGFWYSVDEDWERWCHAESFGKPKEMFRYEVSFPSDLNLLKLKSPQEIIDFTKSYGNSKNTGKIYFNGILIDPIESTWNIDWKRVSKEYSGIEIAPYQWECRGNPKTLWYYNWDCASGVLWDLKGVRIDPIDNWESSIELDDPSLIGENP